MLGLKRLEADFVYGGDPDAFTAALDAGSGEGLLELGFQVEEAEMLVDLECRLLMDVSANDTLRLTFFVDGVDVETVGTAGLYQVPLLTASDPTSIYLNKTVRLDQGFHTVEVRMLTVGNGIPTIAGATIPAELVARRHSHPATLGHGVDSKVQLIQ